MMYQVHVYIHAFTHRLHLMVFSIVLDCKTTFVKNSLFAVSAGPQMTRLSLNQQHEFAAGLKHRDTPSTIHTILFHEEHYQHELLGLMINITLNSK